MATTEAKAEANKEVEEEHVQPITCKTVVLKVSIHCEGCKRKVKKILQTIQGVYNIDIDLRQQKVVVTLTGNVNSETLIKKLTKAGKHAELWPQQKADSKKKKQPKPEKQTEPEEETTEEKEETNQTKENSDKKEAVKVAGEESSKNAEATGNAGKNSDGSNKADDGSATSKAGVQFHEPKGEVRQTVVLPAQPVTEKKVSVAVQVNEASEKSEGKKKKKKGKANNTNTNVASEGASATTVTVERCVDGAVNGGLPPQAQAQHVTGLGPPPAFVQMPSPINQSPPRHHHMYHHYPPHYYAAPPVHTVNYHAAYPSSSYGTAYYASPQQYSYAHVVRPGNEMEQPPPYIYEPESYTSSQPSDSFVLFSDENPNACSVM